MKLTRVRKKKYMEHAGNICPYCGSGDITGAKFNSDCMSSWRTVSCKSCGKNWRDVYTLVDIEEV